MSDDENLSDPGTGRADPEGVRIIGAEEAAQALERDDIAPGLGQHMRGDAAGGTQPDDHHFGFRQQLHASGFPP